MKAIKRCAALLFLGAALLGPAPAVAWDDCMHDIFGDCQMWPTEPAGWLQYVCNTLQYDYIEECISLACASPNGTIYITEYEGKLKCPGES